MKQIQNKDLAELLMQVRFAPPKRRRRQVDCAEQLLDIIEKDKEYPFEFVCFKITGFRPKGDAGRRLIKGEELAEDLRLFIWKLSGQVAASTSDLGEEIYTTRQLAEKLRVSTKTIDRWRKRGLRVRKFVFDDGRKRLGFSKSVVDKFLNENPKLVDEADRFTRLSAERKREIIKRAGVLSSETEMSRRQIIRKIAAEMGRGQETIRCVLLGYEKSHPGFDSLRKAGGQLNPAETAEVDRLQKHGAGIKELMSRFSRSKSSIYRILKQRRIQALLAKKIEFIQSEEFLEPDAEERILGDRRGIERREQESQGVSPMLMGQSPEKYLEGLKDASALNRQEEMELFRRYNYLKYRAFLAREQIVAGLSTRLPASPKTTGLRGAGSISSARLDEIEKYLAEAEAVKKTIIETNMRLVVSVANRHTITGTNIGDLVSEGNVSLMQAVEKFDYTKGFRFSTYATWAISKDFAHRIPGQKARADRTASAVSEFEEEFKTVDVVAVERARHDLIQVIRDNLEPREQLIIINHFGLEGTLVKKNRKTLKQIGDELGLSKERVRQIELVCLQKLRQSLSPEQFDLLMG